MVKMQNIKSILKIAGALLVLSCLLICSSCIHWIIKQTDTFYLMNAELENPGLLYEIEKELQKDNDSQISHKKLTVHAHRIKKGDGIILGYRKFDGGWMFIMDDERFEKLTIWLPDNQIQKEKVYDLEDSENILALYTEGSSCWFLNTCSGYLKTGTVKIKRSGKSYRVEVDGILELHGTLKSHDWCKSKPVKMVFNAGKIEHDSLTPWLGKEGRTPIDETYRR